MSKREYLPGAYPDACRSDFVMDGDALSSNSSPNTDMPDDFVQPFQIESGAARGRLVCLGPAVQRVIAGHQYPEPVAALLTQAIALSALVATSADNAIAWVRSAATGSGY